MNTLPTKRQHELLTYIGEFISEHGYSPTYREIMRALHYSSVATVAQHVGELVKRGHLLKKGRSARSLIVVQHSLNEGTISARGLEIEQAIEDRLEHAQAYLSEHLVHEITVLVAALTVLKGSDTVREYVSALTALEQRLISDPTSALPPETPAVAV